MQVPFFRGDEVFFGQKKKDVIEELLEQQNCIVSLNMIRLWKMRAHIRELLEML
jgi:hypothetical protein